MSHHRLLLSDFWNDQLVAHDRQWVFLVLLGLLLSFGFIRMSTRLMRSPRVPWWPGSVVSDGGVHVHHLVFGIVLMMLAGTISFAGFATNPIYEICAFAFGIGIGPDDRRVRALGLPRRRLLGQGAGRASVDAAVIAVALHGPRPARHPPVRRRRHGNAGAVHRHRSSPRSSWSGRSSICFLKGRLAHGILGFFVPPLAIYGAFRLGKPDSWWAKRLYGERNPKKQARSEARFDPSRRTERFKQ